MFSFPFQNNRKDKIDKDENEKSVRKTNYNNNNRNFSDQMEENKQMYRFVRHSMARNHFIQLIYIYKLIGFISISLFTDSIKWKWDCNSYCLWCMWARIECHFEGNYWVWNRAETNKLDTSLNRFCLFVSLSSRFSNLLLLFVSIHKRVMHEPHWTLLSSVVNLPFMFLPSIDTILANVASKIHKDT